MKDKTNGQQKLGDNFKFMFGLALLMPAMAQAHVLSITPTTPFPDTIAASSESTATFEVKNIASRIKFTAIPQDFPVGSGLSIASSTCGNLLLSGQSCTIQVSMSATANRSVVSGLLRVKAPPTADGVQWPIEAKITASLPSIILEPVNSSNLPSTRAPVLAQVNGNWLLVSASTGNFHDFGNTFLLTSIYVYNPDTTQIYSQSIAGANLPVAVQNQLLSIDQQFLQDGNTLYLIGGYYTPDNVNWTTLDTITAINIPGMMNAIMNNVADLSPFVFYQAGTPQFKVTGGGLGKIGNDFYLTFGQDCDGFYCGTSQVYTNSIYKFTTDPTLSSINFVQTVTRQDSDGSGWRRRDYTLVPFKTGANETLFAMGGPFTPGDNAQVWTNGINFDANIQANDGFINQQANQYEAAFLSMYSVSQNKSYVATFGGLSNLYWGTNGLAYDNTTPLGNLMDLITYDSAGAVQEYANLAPLCSGYPLSNCLYMGLNSAFLPINKYYDYRGILQLDQLRQNERNLVGYVYGGLTSFQQNIFNGGSQSSNQVYAVYITPNEQNKINWQNVTNMNPGN